MVMELKTTNDTTGCKAVASLSVYVSGVFCGVASLWMVVLRCRQLRLLSVVRLEVNESIDVVVRVCLVVDRKSVV